jgi:glycosyltransferase involved in cell wall biosynthesis
MRKVLIIAYYFPPFVTIGSQRPYRLAKYFPNYGWEPVILTVKREGNLPDGIRVIETDYNDIVYSIRSKLRFGREEGVHEKLGITISKDCKCQTWKSKAIKLVREVLTFPDPQRGWYDFALKSASKLLFNERVDVIISTSFPVTSHLIAQKLKQKYNIPWIADLRDLWTQNHFYDKFDFIKYFERRLELKTLVDADIIVTVTKRFADELKNLHSDKQIFCITNGYDADDFPEMPVKLMSKFTITHTGQLYNGQRDPSLLFEVIAKLLNENKLNKNLIEIRFYGRLDEWLMEMIKKYELQYVVSYYGFLQREEALQKQKESHILLLLLDSNNKEEGVYPAKIFEYFGAKRPIIAIGGYGGIVKELLEETNAGKFAVNADQLRDIILASYQEYIKYGDVRYSGNANIDNYKYISIAQKYSKLLNGLVKK